jgi:hypothetical protein
VTTGCNSKGPALAHMTALCPWQKGISHTALEAAVPYEVAPSKHVTVPGTLG